MIRALVRSFVLAGVGCVSLWAHGTITHIAEGGSWSTIVMLVNGSGVAHDVTIWFWSSDGQPLQVPVKGLGPVYGVGYYLGPYASGMFETEGRPGPTLVGWASVESPVAPGDVSITTVFRNRMPGQPEGEATVPLDGRSDSRFYLFFDHRAGFATGLAVVNLWRESRVVIITFRDAAGKLITSSGFALSGKGHAAITLQERYPETVGRWGSVEILTQAGFGEPGLSVLGLRFNPSGTFTSIQPVRGMY